MYFILLMIIVNENLKRFDGPVFYIFFILFFCRMSKSAVINRIWFLNRNVGQLTWHAMLSIRIPGVSPRLSFSISPYFILFLRENNVSTGALLFDGHNKMFKAGRFFNSSLTTAGRLVVGRLA